MTTLSSRSGRYFSRLLVPSDLRQLIGRREILKSLRCSSYRRATLLCARWEGHLAKLFITLRANHQRMTQEQIEALVQHYLSTTLMECEEARLERGRVPEAEQEGTWLALSGLLDGTVTQLADHDYTKVVATVDELLAAHKLTLEKTSPAYKKLCRSILVAQQRIFRIEMDRLDGNYLDEGSNGLGRASIPASNGRPSSDRGGLSDIFAPAPTITEAIKLYMEHYAHRDKRTNVEKAMVFQRFAESLPAKHATLLKDITKANCIAFRNAYSELPRRTPDKLRGLPMGDILKALKGDRGQGTKYIRVTHNTVNQALTDLRHLFTWAIRHDHYTAGRNPVDGIEYEGVKGKSYEPFSDADLKALFNNPEFKKQRTKYPARFWLPLILLFSGARRSEIDQLALEDIRQDESEHLWFMDLRFDEEKGRRLKNTTSIRRVPVHSHLLEVGLLDYIADLRKRKQTLMFPRPARQNNRGKGRETVGDRVGKWWARLIKSANVKGNKNLHSLRHTVITRLAAAGVPQDIREVLVGHAAGNVHGQIYVHREAIPLALLRQHLEKLDFRHLFGEAHAGPIRQTIDIGREASSRNLHGL